MRSEAKLHRDLARDNGLSIGIRKVVEKQEGYGRKGVYVYFNDYYGDIDRLYLGSVFPNLREHFNVEDDEFLTTEQIVIDHYSEQIYEYLDSIED